MEEIQLIATKRYSRRKEKYKLLQDNDYPEFLKMTIAKSIIDYAIMIKDRDIYVKGYKELLKCTDNIINSDIDYSEGSISVVSLKETSDVKVFTNDNAYLKVCNVLKENREYYEETLLSLDDINYWNE